MVAERDHARQLVSAQDVKVAELENIIEQQFLELQRTEHIVAIQNSQDLKNLEDRAKNALFNSRVSLVRDSFGLKPGDRETFEEPWRNSNV